MLAYFDCFSGISGDMTLGALVDLGVPVEWLARELRRLPLKGFQLESTTVSRGAMRVHRLEVRIAEEKQSRTFADIRGLIENAPLDEEVSAFALEAFTRIAEAESRIHGCRLDAVHFHEVGGTDALVDIVGTALCRKYLGIREVVVSPLPLGSGTVTCRHGVLPVPAPATLAILKDVPVSGNGAGGEQVTPTGAALATTLATAFGALPPLTVRRVGYGAGSRDAGPLPNVLRVILGEGDSAEDDPDHDRVIMVESNVDDMNPEIFGYLMERLFEDGALDVWWVPVQMKKNRPGTMLQVLCRPARLQTVITRILSETTTLGVRHYEVRRTLLRRETVRVDTRFGTIAAKKIRTVGGRSVLVPEYESCRRVARAENIPLKHACDVLIEEMRKNTPSEASDA